MKKLLLILSLVSLPYAAFATTETFNYTGAVQSWEVPVGVTSVTINALGGSGTPGTTGTNGGASSTAGLGGSATGTLSVVAGTIYYIGVGFSTSTTPYNTSSSFSGGTSGSDRKSVV